MKIQFIGAAQTVTGSQHLLHINGKKILLDCGLYQGKRKEAFEINRHFKFNPEQVDLLLLSHAHIDHSGNIPSLVKNGFKGHIYTTAATVDLCNIMLRDSAYLQERDVKWVNKKRAKENKKLFEPLYTEGDVEIAMQHFIGVQYDNSVEVSPGVIATFRDAGHILGSASIQLEITENGKQIRLGFTGDIGRDEMPILRDPNRLRDLDVIIMESTYGNRLHAVSGEVEEELATIIRQVADRKGKIIIPSFAVGRTQLIVYMLHKLWEENRIPPMPIYVDSPLAVRATEVFRHHPECFDRETNRFFLQDHEDPFGFRRLKYITDVEDSKALNTKAGPYIIISASGMAEGGRILHHLKNNIENPNNLILFVGYAAENTLARKIMDGAEEANILGEKYKIKSQIKKMDYFSAHADQKGFVEYLKFNSFDKLKNIFLVHGEEIQAMPLKKKLEEKGYSNIYFPAPDDIFEI